MPSRPAKPSRPQPLLTALGALAVAGIIGFLIVDSLTTGTLDFRSLHLSRDADPALFWAAEAFFGVMGLLALAGVAVAVKAMIFPDRPGKGPPPEFR